MDLEDYKQVNFYEIADLERAKKNKIYSKGDILIQMSATKGQVFYLEEDKTVDSKYAVITCKNVDSKYFYYIVKDTITTFLIKYQTGINLQPEIFNYLSLQIHSCLNVQKHIAKIFDKIDEEIKNEEMMINELKDFKKYHLNKMFI